jgi:hypothetical protein
MNHFTHTHTHKTYNYLNSDFRSFLFIKLIDLRFLKYVHQCTENNNVSKQLHL